VSIDCAWLTWPFSESWNCEQMRSSSETRSVSLTSSTYLGMAPDQYSGVMAWSAEQGERCCWKEGG
jgi:hypothetical protein